MRAASPPGSCAARSRARRSPPRPSRSWSISRSPDGEQRRLDADLEDAQRRRSRPPSPCRRPRCPRRGAARARAAASASRFCTSRAFSSSAAEIGRLIAARLPSGGSRRSRPRGSRARARRRDALSACLAPRRTRLARAARGVRRRRRGPDLQLDAHADAPKKLSQQRSSGSRLRSRRRCAAKPAGTREARARRARSATADRPRARRRCPGSARRAKARSRSKTTARRASDRRPARRRRARRRRRSAAARAARDAARAARRALRGPLGRAARCARRRARAAAGARRRASRASSSSSRASSAPRRRRRAASRAAPAPSRAPRRAAAPRRDPPAPSPARGTCGAGAWRRSARPARAARRRPPRRPRRAAARPARCAAPRDRAAGRAAPRRGAWRRLPRRRRAGRTPRARAAGSPSTQASSIREQRRAGRAGRAPRRPGASSTSAAAVGDHLVEQRLRVAQRAVGLARDREQARLRDRRLPRRRAIARRRSTISADEQPAQVVALAARDHRERDLLGVRRREHEQAARRRLLERLEQRVEGRRREHVHLVDDEDAVLAGRGRVADRRDQLAHVVDAGAARGVDLLHVGRACRRRSRGTASTRRRACPSGPSSQLRQRARMRASVVLPTPRGPVSRIACGTRCCGSRCAAAW